MSSNMLRNVGRTPVWRRVALGVAFGITLASPAAWAAPLVNRLTPPSNLFRTGDPTLPVVSRFLPGQRFDLQATIAPDSGRAIENVWFYVDGKPVPGAVSLVAADVAGLPAGTQVASLRGYSNDKPRVRELTVVASQTGGGRVEARGNFEVVDIQRGGLKAKNVIVLIGDGMGIAHRTAARIMLHGVSQGKANDPLAMDTLPHTALVMTHSLNSIVTDSSPGASCYSSGNKGNNNQHGVFPDDTSANFDNPRMELITEYLNRVQFHGQGRSEGNSAADRHRTQGKALGIVTTSDIFDATPAAFASHTQSRSAGTGIVDQYLDDADRTGLKVLMGGGRKWFLPNTAPGSARSTATDYTLPADMAAAWGIAQGAIDPARDLIADFQADGFRYVADRAGLEAIPSGAGKLLGLFALSNMNVAKDKIDARRGNPAVVNDYGFPDQPMLDEMAEKALAVLSKHEEGFVLMVEGASIDKQAHNMDTERWILDTIEFDRAVAVARDFAKEHSDTLVVVTADHECAGVNIIGGSRLTNAALQTRAGSGGGAAQLRNGVVGTYDAAGFPRYPIGEDGYPVTTDVDFRMLIGYAANADRYEDWLTNPLPLRDSQQPFNNQPPLSTYPNDSLQRDTAGSFLVTGQIADTVAAHTGSDIPLSAAGRGASLFHGVMDNTEVFFRIMQSVLGGAVPAFDER